MLKCHLHWAQQLQQQKFIKANSEGGQTTDMERVKAGQAQSLTKYFIVLVEELQSQQIWKLWMVWTECWSEFVCACTCVSECECEHLCMSACMCEYMCECVCQCVCVWMCEYVWVCMWIMCMCVNMWVYKVLSVWMCECVSMWMYVWTCEHVWMWVCVGGRVKARVNVGYLLQLLPTVFVDTRSLTEFWAQNDDLAWLASSKAQVFPSLHSSVLALQVFTAVLSFYWVLGLELSSHACITRTLAAEPPPQPHCSLPLRVLFYMSTRPMTCVYWHQWAMLQCI